MKHWRELSRGRKLLQLLSVLLPLPLLWLYLRDPASWLDPRGVENLFGPPLILSFLIGLADFLLTLAGRRPKGEWWSVLRGIALLAAAVQTLAYLYVLALVFLIGTAR